MEHAQRDCKRHNINSVVSLNPYFNGTCSKSQFVAYCKRHNINSVLILILMEHAQRALTLQDSSSHTRCLNPYFNGTCSKRKAFIILLAFALGCLNPYFNGTCSKSRKRVRLVFSALSEVLILILMEHAQREWKR